MADFWKGKNVLVTGANGFIGSNLTRELVQHGARVVAFVHDVNDNTHPMFQPLVKDVVIVEGDVRDLDAVQRTFTEHTIDTAFHLAAQPVVSNAYDSPLPTFKTNIEGTLNMLEASRCSSMLERFVLASTMHVYGNAQPPFVETMPLQSSRPYETSKACADLLAQTYSYTYGVSLAIVRCTNTYGPGDMNVSRIVPKTMSAIVNNENPEIAGGTSRRDYIYIADVVRAYLLLSENLHRIDVREQAFNFGSGAVLSGRDLVKKIIDISGRSSLRLIIQPSQLKKEIDEQYVSSQKARSVLGWEPSFSMEDALRETYRWYQENLHCV